MKFTVVIESDSVADIAHALRLSEEEVRRVKPGDSGCLYRGFRYIGGWVCEESDREEGY